jgi:ABC-2 type transport system permease protein
MNGFAGTGRLFRFDLRRDRLVLPIWVFSVAIMPLVTVSAFRSLYPNEALLAVAIKGFDTNPAFRTMFGPVFGTNLGALVAWRTSIALLIVAVISLLTVIRHTRVEEETGRRELIGSTVVGRHAPLSAALALVTVANIAVFLVVGAGLAAQDLPVTGSFAYGLELATAGILFAAVGALCAQLTENAGSARAIGLGVIGLFYAIRAAGDSAHLEWVSWLSPFGWVQRLKAFAGEQWWVLPITLVLIVGVTAWGYFLASRRDVGGGVFQPRVGPGEASPRLSSPLALAWRLHRGLVYGWTAGLVVLGAIYGSVAQPVGDLLKDNPDLAQIFERMGGTAGGLIDMYLAGVMGVLGLFVTAYSVQATLRARVEEDALRAEPVLATSVSRSRWLTSHLVFAAAGPAVAMLVGGLAIGITYGAAAGDVGGQSLRMLGAAAVRLPAVWVVVAIVAALFGLLPRLSALGWAVYGSIVFITFIGAILQLGQWFLDLSPFTHVPALPGAELVLLPLAALLSLAVVLVVGGFMGFRTRDVA